VRLAVVYDTETTGLPLFSEPSEDPRQPHIVQLAAALVDLDAKKTVSSINVIVRPASWLIPQDVVLIHGITYEHAMDVGVEEDEALDIFMSLHKGRLRIAHNESFDARIIRIALMRYWPKEDADKWKGGDSECTMRLAQKVMGGKTPKLIEAYKHFTGKDLTGAHNAMTDMLACRDVYYSLKGLA
jgi:DNA polymerase-3 subunit epsilon